MFSVFSHFSKLTFSPFSLFYDLHILMKLMFLCILRHYVIRPYCNNAQGRDDICVVVLPSTVLGGGDLIKMSGRLHRGDWKFILSFSPL